MKSWKMFFIVCLVTVFTVFAAHAIRTEGTGVNTPRVQKTALTQSVNTNFGNVPLYFIPNNGQMDGNALFYARTASYTLWMTESGLIFDSVIRDKGSGVPYPLPLSRDVSRLVFMDAGKNPVVVPEDPAAHMVNYLRGSDKSGWHTNIPTSKAVRYKDLYRGIDLKVYGTEKQIEYDWVVEPGANPGDICFRYRNVKESRIDEHGNLVIQTAFGLWTHKKPVGFQVIDGKNVSVAVAFKNRESGKHTYGFNVGTYDKGYELVIDPMIVAYSTFLGGSGFDDIRGIEVDGTGSVYAAGSTQSTDFPTAYGYQAGLNGFKDAVITRFTPDGTGLVFSTYLGGSYGETAYDIALDGTGAIYVGGMTDSTDFPTVNAFQGTHHGGTYDGFVAKLSPDGSYLLYSTYLGGSDYDEPEAIAVNGSGELYVCGATGSSDFPLQNAIQPVHGGGNDAFVAKLSSTGGSLVYSTFLGGGGSDIAYAINVDAAGYQFSIPDFR